MNNNKGCINWLEQEFLKLESTVGVLGVFYELLEQAKAMHKEEIITTWHKGYDNLSPMIDEDNCGDKYYNETYRGNK